MPRTPPPRGCVTFNEAMDYVHSRGLNVSKGMIYKWVKAGRLQRQGPEARKQKYYSLKELERIVDEELNVQPEHVKATFARAMLQDLEGITALSAKLFNTPTITPISTETRRAWLLKEPRGHYVVKTARGKILAYLHILALTDAKIREYMTGRIMGRNLTGEDVQVFVPGIPQSVIVASIGSNPDLSAPARRRFTSILLHGVSRDTALLGLQGITIDRVYAWSESRSGISLCARMGMQQYSQPMRYQGPDDHETWRYMFCLDVQHSTKPFLQSYQRALHEWQTSHINN